MKRRAFVFAVLIVSLVGSAAALAQAQKPLVVVSFFPVSDFAWHQAADRAEVVSLVPPGVGPHDWEPAPQDMLRLQRAKLFVYNGVSCYSSPDRVGIASEQMHAPLS